MFQIGMEIIGLFCLGIVAMFATIKLVIWLNGIW